MRKTLALALGAGLVAACGPPHYTETPVPLAACLMTGADASVDPRPGESGAAPAGPLEVTGELIEIGVGEPEPAETGDGGTEPPAELVAPLAGCFEAGGVGTPSDRFDLSAARRLVIRDDQGTRWTAGLMMPRAAVPCAPGDRVTVGWARGADGAGRFSLSFEDGDLLAWLGRAPGLGALSALGLPEGLSLAQGDAVHEEVSECGGWSAYEIDASFGDETFALTYGEQTLVGDVLLSHGGYRMDEGPDATCATDDALFGIGLWGG